VVGSGVAGLSVVVRLAQIPGMRVGVLTKAELSQSATRWAQGGVAAVLGGDEDSTDLHLADTLAAGAGLCDVDAVRVLVDEGPLRVRELIALGAVFDREAGGSFARSREGGHSTARVLHAGGAATGAEVERALVSAVESTATAVLESWFAIDLIVESGRCRGVVASGPDGEMQVVRADHVVIATGGAGQLYAVTTNPKEATGDGIAMALRAGVGVADVEFFQFHPTALHHPAMPRPLLSEALRGHGAKLRDARGDRFVDELAPRDVVSRAMAQRMAEQGVDHLWLDARSLESFDERFPTLASSLHAAGLDPSNELLPIAPAAHYISGGILTDLDGASTLEGLWAAGEAACTGVHGANRLASNSLLEGMVFAARLSEAIARGKSHVEATGAMRGWLYRGTDDLGESAYDAAIPCRLVEVHAGAKANVGISTRRVESADIDKARHCLQRAMTEGAGVLRSLDSLAATTREVNEASAVADGFEPGRDRGELANLVEVSRALLRSAEMREETRGAHARIEYPETVPAWRLRLTSNGA